ncbi:MAG: hypothetical protein SR1Q5_07275 [Quinella sp. 1Q5]|nr:hypothetical protein [Quinella sp. 1Q5]
MFWGKYIENYDSNTVITTTADDDSIENVNNPNYGEAKNVLINAGKGNDTIKNEYANNVTINGGAGNDYISNDGGLNLSINGSSGDDAISNDYYHHGGHNATINGGTGNDYINNNGDNALISGGSGKDYICNDGDSVTINGGAGNDEIDNHGDNVTILGGTGNDSVEESDYNVNTVYVYSGGNDTLTHFRGLGTIVLGSVEVNSSLRSSNGTVKLNLSNNKTLTLKNYLGEGVNIVSSISDVKKFNVIRNPEGNSFIKGTNKNDFISNVSSDGYFTISGGKGNDYIYSHAYHVSIDGGAGNDSIISGSEYNTLIGGSGNDTIYNDAGNATKILGGAGDDTIYSHGYDVSIDGGAGNDLVSLNAYSASDVIIYYNEGDGNDTIYGFKHNQLSIANGMYSTEKSGNDVIVTVGDGKITLVGAASLSKLNINGTKATSTTLTVKNSTKSPVTVGSAIKTINASKRTTAIKITGNSLANTITGGSYNDSIYGGGGNDSILGGTGNDKLFGNAGNDSLSGGDGADTLSGGTGNDKLFDNAGNDSLSGGDGKDTLSGGDGDDKILGGAGNDSLSGGNGKDTLSGGSGNDKLLGGSNNDCIKGGSGNDSLWGGTGNDSLWGDAGADRFIYAEGDGKDIIYGFENSDTLTLDGLEFTSSYSKSKGTLALTFDEGSITFKNFTATTFHIDGNTYKISGSKLVKK